MSLDTTAGKLADLRARLEKAQDPGSENSRKRRDEAGRTTPRQRINMPPTRMGLLLVTAGLMVARWWCMRTTKPCMAAAWA